MSRLEVKRISRRLRAQDYKLRGDQMRRDQRRGNQVGRASDTAARLVGGLEMIEEHALETYADQD